jgi:ELWxxDGT repeat protein
MIRPILAALSLAGITGIATAAAAQTATLVEDIAAQEGPAFGGNSSLLHPIGQRVFFLHSDSLGEDVWASDGTVPGTRPLADVCQDFCEVMDRNFLGTVGGRLVWQDGRRLWSTDGTPAGTTPLIDPDLSLPSDADVTSALLGNRIYFVACGELDDEPSCGLWSTDGTRAGTEPVPVLTPDPERIIPFGLVAGSDRVYFIVDHASFRLPRELWMADANGARRLLDLPERFSKVWTAWGNRLFFAVLGNNTRELWATDGTSAGTHSLGSFDDEPFLWLSTGASGLYFIADDIVHGAEIWRSDGTLQGTRRVTEFGYVDPFFNFAEGREGFAYEIDGSLLFFADDHHTGQRLWMSTGTPESTRAVSQPYLSPLLHRAGNRLFALRRDPKEEDCELWSFDGKGAGMRLVDHLSGEHCAPNDPRLSYLRTVGSRVYLSAQDVNSKWSVWRSDGTPQGTERLLSSPSYIGEFAVTAGERSLYYMNGRGLWVWDAKDGSRQMIGAGVRNASSLPQDLVSHQGGLAFTAGDGTGDPTTRPQRMIWSSQGSAENTSLSVNLAGTGCTTPEQLFSLGSRLLFSCELSLFDAELRVADPAGGGSLVLAGRTPENLVLTGYHDKVWFAAGNSQEVWTTDGTPGGTARFTDAGGSPLHAVFHSNGVFAEPFALSDGDLLYFQAKRPDDQDFRLWRTDGTPAGTLPLTIVSRSTSEAFELARAGSTTLVNMDSKLWRTDGSAPGTVALTRSTGEPLLRAPSLLTGHNGAFYVYSESSFWRTDGTAEGTVALAPPFEWLPAYSEYFPIPKPASLGAKLFFVAADPQHGIELWVTDGTPAGTSLLADISPGPSSSVPSGLVAAGGAVWFTAQDPKHGRELWRTDGTAAGTRLVQDIAPEGRSSSPDQLTVAGDRLYFSADDGINGRELWTVPLTGPGGCQPSDTALCLQGGRFRVESRWRDFQGNGGVGKAVPLTADTGTFWFFSPSNVEVLLKVLDGRDLNEHFWVFYGALSNVEYSLTVTDTQTGLARRYSNPAGQLASAGDTQGFGPRGAQSTVPDELTAPPSQPALVHAWSSTAATEPCAPGPQRLCLNSGRFAVEVSWKDFQGNTGKGTAVPFTGDTGTFWFFDPSNVELAVKVLDGRPVNNKFWVFYGALSNVEYTIRVTDTETGSVKEYKNPSGHFGSVGDTGAF